MVGYISVRCLTTLCGAGCKDDRWKKWKGFGRKQSWFILGNLLVHIGGAEETKSLSYDSRYPGQGPNRVPPKYSVTATLFSSAAGSFEHEHWSIIKCCER
jgi:hypothetical protein